MTRREQPRTALEDWLDGGPPPEGLQLVDQIAESHAGQPPDAIRAALRSARVAIPEPALDELADRLSHREVPPPSAVRAHVRGRVGPG